MEEWKLFKVSDKCCDQCLFSPNKIVSEKRKESLLKKITKEQSYFVCHKATIKGEETCCRGFYEKLGAQSQMIRIAERLGEVEFIPSQ
jgi:hypothetical protein